MKDKLIKFIIDNKLNFNGSGSALNGMCTVISGYALHIEASVGDIKEAIAETFPKATSYQKELERVYKVAEDRGYGTYWSTTEAKEMYKF